MNSGPSPKHGKYRSPQVLKVRARFRKHTLYRSGQEDAQTRALSKPTWLRLTLFLALAVVLH